MLLHDGSMTQGRVSAPQAIRVIFAGEGLFLTQDCQGADQGIYGRDGAARAAGLR